MIHKLLIRLLSLFVLFQIGILYAGYQPMGILKGVYKISNKGVEIPAYCLDFYAENPTIAAKYVNFNTEVEILTANGVLRNTLDNFVIANKLKISGINNENDIGIYSALKFEKGTEGEEIIAITFLENTVATTNNYDKYPRNYLTAIFKKHVVDNPLLTAYKEMDHPAYSEVIQMELWKVQEDIFNKSGLKNQLKIKIRETYKDAYYTHIKEETINSLSTKRLEIKKGSEKERFSFKTQNSTISETHTIGRLGYDLDNNLTINYLYLVGGGNSFIVKTPANELLIFDTGKVKFDAKRIKDFIQEYEGEIETVKMFVTHTDADHLNGLKRWLKEGIQIEEIIVSNVEKIGRGREQLEKFRNVLMYKKGYTEEYLSGRELIRYGKKATIKFEDISGNFNKIRSYRVNLTKGGDQMIFHKYINGSNVNDLSIISKIQHAGVSHLSMGDVGITAIKNLLNENEVQRTSWKDKMEELLKEVSEMDAKLRVKETIVSGDLFIEIVKESAVDLTAKKLGAQFNFQTGSIYQELTRLNEDAFITYENFSDMQMYWEQMKIQVESVVIDPETVENAIIETVIGVNKEIEGVDKAIKDRNELVKKYNQLLMRYEELSLESTVLQWPHHWWLPDMSVPSNEMALDRLLQVVSPQYIVLSKPPNGVGQNLENLLNYLKGFQKKYGVTFKIKELNGQNFEIIGELHKIQQGKPAFSLG